MTQLTRQPTGGRRKEGGLRIGEMERDSLISHGIAGFIQESMMERSDKYRWQVCKRCGTIPNYSKKINSSFCPLCENNETSIIETPYCLKLLNQELEAMNIQMRFNCDNAILPDNILETFDADYDVNEILDNDDENEIKPEPKKKKVIIADEIKPEPKKKKVVIADDLKPEPKKKKVVIADDLKPEPKKKKVVIDKEAEKEAKKAAKEAEKEAKKAAKEAEKESKKKKKGGNNDDDYDEEYENEEEEEEEEEEEDENEEEQEEEDEEEEEEEEEEGLSIVKVNNEEDNNIKIINL
jgi:hypothetical protein